MADVGQGDGVVTEVLPGLVFAEAPGPDQQVVGRPRGRMELDEGPAVVTPVVPQIASGREIPDIDAAALVVAVLGRRRAEIDLDPVAPARVDVQPPAVPVAAQVIKGVVQGAARRAAGVDVAPGVVDRGRSKSAHSVLVGRSEGPRPAR